MKKPTFKLEDTLPGPVCGIDEVGRGPLAGPVVAAAVIFRREGIPKKFLAAINDSKKLTATRRQEIAAALPDFAHVSIAEAAVEEIDSLNILQASLLAMRRAVEKLDIPPAAALVDGNRCPGLGCKTLTVVGGDAKSLSIAAASIAAKVHRDALMARLAAEYPGYGWERNSGYGTREHLKALKELGITRWHRRSFRPIYEEIDITN